MYKYYFNENNYLQKIFPKHNFLFILLNISHINSLFTISFMLHIFSSLYQIISVRFYARVANREKAYNTKTYRISNHPKRWKHITATAV